MPANKQQPETGEYYNLKFILYTNLEKSWYEYKQIIKEEYPPLLKYIDFRRAKVYTAIQAIRTVNKLIETNPYK